MLKMSLMRLCICLVRNVTLASTLFNLAERTGKCQIPYFNVSSEFQRNFVFGTSNHLSPRGTAVLV